MTWKVAYLAVFFAGLALAVNSMLHGSERWKRRKSLAPSALFNPPTVAALAAGFGVGGYLLNTKTALSTGAVFALALCCAAAGYFAMTILMAKWALRHPANNHEEEETNGQVAIVTRPIASDSPGEITYIAWDRKHVLAARSIDGSPIDVNTEVVIDVVEDNIATVERWSVVEQRL